MSELVQGRENRANIRRRLLASASALALTAIISSAKVARAEDASQPQLWIELGGQLSRLGDSQEVFSPEGIFDSRPTIFSPSQKFEKSPAHSIDEYGKISLQPTASDWTFSAAVRYGRSASNRHVRQQTNPEPFHKYFPTTPTQLVTIPPVAAKFAETKVRSSEDHLVLDFQAGKDVGLGLFGREGSSIVSVGVRFAQFHSQSNISIKSDPDWHFHYNYLSYPSAGFTNFKFVSGQRYHSNWASLSATRSFRGVGPSLSWAASAPFSGSQQNGELTVDWGANVALLFGRQKSRTHHQTTARYQTGGTVFHPDPRPAAIIGTPINTSHTRSRNVIVPNVGGSFGLSWRLQDFKVSMGYRADFFFGAMDGGIDSRKTYDRDFYGPYASITIGLGG